MTQRGKKRFSHKEKMGVESVEKMGFRLTFGRGYVIISLCENTEIISEKQGEKC